MDDMLADFQIVGLIENGMLADFQVVSPIEDVLLVQDVYQIETKWSCSASAVPHYKRWSDLRLRPGTNLASFGPEFVMD